MLRLNVGDQTCPPIFVPYDILMIFFVEALPVYPFTRLWRAFGGLARLWREESVRRETRFSLLLRRRQNEYSI